MKESEKFEKWFEESKEGLDGLKVEDMTWHAWRAALRLDSSEEKKRTLYFKTSLLVDELKVWLLEDNKKVFDFVFYPERLRVDLGVAKKMILEICKVFEISEVCLDPYNSSEMLNFLRKHGVNVRIAEYADMVKANST